MSLSRFECCSSCSKIVFEAMTRHEQVRGCHRHTHPILIFSFVHVHVYSHSEVAPTPMKHVRSPSSAGIFSTLRRSISAPPVMVQTPQVPLPVVRCSSTTPTLASETVKARRDLRPIGRSSTSVSSSSSSSNTPYLPLPSDCPSTLTAAHGVTDIAQESGAPFRNLRLCTLCFRLIL